MEVDNWKIHYGKTKDFRNYPCEKLGENDQ